MSDDIRTPARAPSVYNCVQDEKAMAALALFAELPLVLSTLPSEVVSLRLCICAALLQVSDVLLPLPVLEFDSLHCPAE